MHATLSEHGTWGLVMLRAIGVLLLVAALAAFGWDLYQWQFSGRLQLAALGELWFRLDPGSLNLAQAVTQRYLLPELWDPVLLTVLLWPAALVLGGLGLVLTALGGLGRRRW